MTSEELPESVRGLHTAFFKVAGNSGPQSLSSGKCIINYT